MHVEGENAELVDRLRLALELALGERRGFYEVRIHSVGRIGDVLVSITSRRGHVPFVFAQEELEPGYVSRVIGDTVSRFGV
jgi:hypothetical protein